MDTGLGNITQLADEPQFHTECVIRPSDREILVLVLENGVPGAAKLKSVPQWYIRLRLHQIKRDLTQMGLDARALKDLTGPIGKVRPLTRCHGAEIETVRRHMGDEEVNRYFRGEPRRKRGS